MSDGSIKIGKRVITPSRKSFGDGWVVHNPVNGNIEIWTQFKGNAIRHAIKKTRQEGAYGETIALIAEVVLNDDSD